MKNSKLAALLVFVLMIGVSACKSTEMATEATQDPASTEMPTANAEPAAQTQTTKNLSSVNVDDIVKKHIEARGGIDAIKAVQSVQMTGTVEAMGMDIDMTMSMKRPYKMRAQLLIQSMNAEVNQGFDGETAWVQNPGSDPQELPAAVTGQFKDQADIDGPLIGDEEVEVEYMGTEDVNDSPSHKIKLTRKGRPDSIVYLDSSSYLEVKSESEMPNPQTGAMVRAETFSSDYRSVGGVQMPHRIEVKMDGNTMQTLTFEKIDLNVELEESLFEMPGISVDMQ